MIICLSFYQGFACAAWPRCRSRYGALLVALAGLDLLKVSLLI
jgi:hypothetical protein